MVSELIVKPVLLENRIKLISDSLEHAVVEHFAYHTLKTHAEDMVRIDIFKICPGVLVLPHYQVFPVIVIEFPCRLIVGSKALAVKVNIHINPHFMLQQKLSDLDCQILNSFRRQSCRFIHSAVASLTMPLFLWRAFFFRFLFHLRIVTAFVWFLEKQ